MGAKTYSHHCITNYAVYIVTSFLHCVCTVSYDESIHESAEINLSCNSKAFNMRDMTVLGYTVQHCKLLCNGSISKNNDIITIS